MFLETLMVMYRQALPELMILILEFSLEMNPQVIFLVNHKVNLDYFTLQTVQIFVECSFFEEVALGQDH